MSNPSDNQTLNDQELLVSYLDGELDADVAAEVENRLMNDEAFRTQLNQMRETWDLLDELPHPTVDQGFTQTTVEMVAVKAADDTAAASGWRRPRVWLMALPVACLIGSFLLVRNVQSRNEAQLIHELPILERLDEYRLVENVEFLEQLVDEGLFTASADVDDPTDEDESAGADAMSNSMSDAMAAGGSELTIRQQVALRSPDEKHQLQERHRQFAQLNPDDADRIRRLHTQLSTHPRSEQLLTALTGYSQWLGDLDATVVAEISELSSQPSQQAEKVVQLMEQQGDQELRRLSLTETDADLIRKWFFEAVPKNRDQLWNAFRPGRQPPRTSGDPRENFMFVGMIARLVTDEREFAKGISSRLLARLPEERLVEDLSSGAREHYRKQLNEQDKTKLMHQWLRVSLRMRSRPPRKTDDELLDMRVHMPEDQQASLEGLPRGEVIEEIRKWYEGKWWSRARRSPFGGWGDRKDGHGRGDGRRDRRREPGGERRGRRGDDLREDGRRGEGRPDEGRPHDGRPNDGHPKDGYHRPGADGHRGPEHSNGPGGRRQPPSDGD